MANSSDRDPNSPSPDSSQHQEIENLTVTGGVQELQGDKNRTVSGEKNTAIQGSHNLLLQIQNLVFGRSSEEEQKSTRSRSQQSLIDKVKEEINGRLHQSLHNRIYILLDKKEDPGQVRPLWSMDVKIGMKDPSPLPQGTKIEEVYDRDDINGKLLILGAPGSGKTTTLLQLAQTLVQRAEDDEKKPIPVLFNLSSWQPKSSIFEWVIEQLNFKYKVRQDIARKWLEKQEILPLLDGLDELAPQYQESCVIGINEFLHSELGSTALVVCSRTKEYNLYDNFLGLNGSIILQYLDRQRIESYLERTDNRELWEMMKSDRDLLELLEIPLFLNIIILACQEISIQKWQGLPSSKERQNYLFDAYIQRMLNRSYQGKQPKKENTIHWLKQLSLRLLVDKESVFFIERIQSDWLDNYHQKFIFGLIFGLTISLTILLIFDFIIWLSFGFIVEFLVRLTLWLTLALIAGLIGKNSIINPVETLSFSFQKKRENLIKNTIKAISIGEITFLTGSMFFASKIFLSGVIIGFILIPIIIPILLIMGEFLGNEIEIKTTPNQGIKKSIKNLICFSKIIALGGFPVILLLQWLFSNFYLQSLKFYLAFTQAILIGLFFGIPKIGTPIIQHFSLRLVLWWNKKIPWDYAHFLDYACDRLFLQRVGGGYCFLHRLLQEHFAEIENFDFSDERQSQ